MKRETTQSLEETLSLAERVFDQARLNLSSVSCKYDKCLSRMHNSILVAYGQMGENDHPFQEYHQGNKWFADLEDGLESTARCVTEIATLVSKLRSSFPDMPKEYIDAEKKLEEHLGRPINLVDISETFKDIIWFKNYASVLPDIETDNKFQDYAKLSRYISLLRLVRQWDSEFSVWIHDTRHYVDRMRAISKPSVGYTISGGNLRSLDALESALYAVRRDSLKDGANGEDDGRKHSSYEPYKLFHKFQHCFSAEFDRIDWKLASHCMTTKLKWAASMDSVVLNIYTNAVKYIPRDGKVHRVTTKFEMRDGNLFINISSLGPFVPKSEIEKIFEDGYRASTADYASTSGHGKGLAAVKRICTEAGYDVWATSVRKAGYGELWGIFSIVIKVPELCIDVQDNG